MSSAPWVNRYRDRLGRTRRQSLSLPPQQEPARPPMPPQRRLVLRALCELAGFDRRVIYDVPRPEAPEPLPNSPIYLRGSPAWLRYLWERRRVDDGVLTPVLALRPLSEAERLLAVDWGATYANSFLLIEPSDPGCDLTDPANAAYRTLEEAAKKLLGSRAPEDEPDLPWTRETALGSLLRLLYGAWIYWSGTYASMIATRVALTPLRPVDTLAALLLTELPLRFPQAEFDRALAELHARESELFHGPATTARMPFRTRLGLPILHDPRYADRALRRLVDDGRARVFRRVDDALYRFGAGRPLPAGMTEVEFEQFLM